MSRSRRDRIVAGLDGRSIVLLGMMGCGKSAIGKLIAKRLRLPFHDADEEIEVAADRSVADIFQEYGEHEFRRLEARVIERVLEEGPVLLSLGGGAFMTKEVRESVAKNAVSLWLDVDLDILVERVGRKPGKRPLLQNGDPKEILSRLLEQRSPVYAKADLRVRSSGVSKSVMRDSVLKRLDKFLQKTAKRENA